MTQQMRGIVTILAALAIMSMISLVRAAEPTAQIGKTGQTSAASQPAVQVQARVVHTADAKPARAPEEWIVKGVQAWAKGHQRPLPQQVAAETGWLSLAMEQRTSIKAEEVKITAEPKMKNGRIIISLGFSTGSANAVGRMELEAKPGVHKVENVTSSGTFLAVEVLAASAKARNTLENFKQKLRRNTTPREATALFGKPDRVLGSGLLIYEYDVGDGAKVRLAFPGYAPFQYAKHVQADGKVQDIAPLADSDK